ncbi:BRASSINOSTEROID INSENSITIVE 1-associated receptor kinase 1-like [Rhodamnia argentea]|uniref:non-specific serine/threonine protein kinase n=1 Tax=Rhodamnia argentea TaxID=178133 RepID=A0A8B8NTK9_9MYRT|nr:BRASSINOSTEROID INSENSITIVE 1-associated receptor kinase 1-like [Rhodamnia argentea]
MVFNFRILSFSGATREVGRTVDNTGNQLRRFSLIELQVATRNFDHENWLGEGSFGVVYRGRLADGSLVAVKRLRELSEDSERQFQTEVEVASIVHHPNLLCLIGYCNVEKERLLVYPFMVNRSLDFLLRQKAFQPLDWPIRMRIASGVARGMAHMHDQCHPSIIHRDVSCSNILLNADFKPVVGDFGLARIMHERDIVVGNAGGSIGCGSVSAAEVGKHPPLLPISPQLYQDTYVYTAVRGHIGYGAPEYISTGKCTRKVDVYLYGNMLLELISGRPFFHFSGLRNDWISRCMNENMLKRVVDPTLQGNYLPEEAERLVRLALLCADDDPSVRPKMSEVILLLENRLHGPDHSSRSSWSQSECDSTPYYSFPPSPSLEMAI